MTTHKWLTRHEYNPDVWDDDSTGSKRDNFARNAPDPHNGPKCKLCGFNFCVHCHPEGWNDTNCTGHRDSLPDGPAMTNEQFRAMADLFR